MEQKAARSLLADHELVLLAEFAIASQRWPQLREIGERLSNEYTASPKGPLFAAMAAREMGDLESAEQILAPAAERFPDADELAVEQARLALEHRDWPMAEERWKIVRTREPHNVSAYLWGAYALRQQHHYEAAESLIAQAMILFPEDSQPIVDYALVAAERGDEAESRRRWEAVLQWFPHDELAQARAREALMERQVDESSQAVESPLKV